AYNKMAQIYERYASELSSARKATESETEKNTGKTFGTFYAQAMRGLGISSFQDKQLKASENTAKNTKRTVKLLEEMSKTSIAFT
ncbi:MAG: hypothetical protein Q4C03_05325, partial [bacterium]|nr:hypothetical protein [bacterium]